MTEVIGPELGATYNTVPGTAYHYTTFSLEVLAGKHTCGVVWVAYIQVCHLRQLTCAVDCMLQMVVLCIK